MPSHSLHRSITPFVNPFLLPPPSHLIVMVYMYMYVEHIPSLNSLLPPTPCHVAAILKVKTAFLYSTCLKLSALANPYMHVYMYVCLCSFIHVLVYMWYLPSWEYILALPRTILSPTPPFGLNVSCPLGGSLTPCLEQSGEVWFSDILLYDHGNQGEGVETSIFTIMLN